MDADLSVNDVSSSNINNTGLIVTHDLSVNRHASIYDLSVGTITIVDGEFTDISVNNHASIYDLSVTNFLVVDGDISANNIRAANFILNVGNGNLIDLSSNVTVLDISFTDLSNNVTVLDTSVTLLDASMAIVEKVASLRYRATDNTPYSGATYSGITSFNISDISDGMFMKQSGTVGEIKIPQTGIYSYNLQLDCSASSTVTFIDLAINNNSVNPATNIANAGSTGGVNRTYVKDIDFTAGSSNTIGLSGISKFTITNEVQPYIKVTGGVGHSLTLDNSNQSIFSMALLYATD